MPRTWVWLQLIIGWLPMWALFMTLILGMHPRSGKLQAASISFRMIVAAAVLGIFVQRLTERFAWPERPRTSFVGLHALAALLYATAWLVLNSLIESGFRGAPVIAVGAGIVPFLVMGVWLYVMVAGITYASHATGRAARAEAAAVRSQLAALRSQLNPHFLFNAMHAVVQLIPRDPRRAAQAAEQLGELLRYTVEEDRDLVSLIEERVFVDRYLALEGLRFGDRLRVQIRLPANTDAALIPSFALLTLVENAVRHGAAPSVEPTDLTVLGRIEDDRLVLTVSDTGVGAARPVGSDGTGLKRLRERLAALYGTGASLTVVPGATRGFTASLTIPIGGAA